MRVADIILLYVSIKMYVSIKRKEVFMTATMFANEVEKNFNNVLAKVANGYEIWVLSDENSPIAMITPCRQANRKQDSSEDLLGFGGILKGLDIPADKKKLRKVYYEQKRDYVNNFTHTQKFYRN